jgi:hypothetical protein
LINPHEHRIIDTHHRDLVRVYIFGTSGFAVRDINPATVELNGVHAVAHITRRVKRDEFPFATYVFVANQLKLPPGLTTATLTGQLKTGQTFISQRDVLNIPNSARVFGQLKKKLGNASFYRALAKIEAKNPSAAISVLLQGARQDRGQESLRCHLGLEHSRHGCLQEQGGAWNRQDQGELHADPGGRGSSGEAGDRKSHSAPGRGD